QTASKVAKDEPKDRASETLKIELLSNATHAATARIQLRPVSWYLTTEGTLDPTAIPSLTKSHLQAFSTAQVSSEINAGRHQTATRVTGLLRPGTVLATHIPKRTASGSASRYNAVKTTFHCRHHGRAPTRCTAANPMLAYPSSWKSCEY